MEKNKKSISVCVITYNEEANIAACLESAKWADEIVVIDSFSTDKTKEIALKYTDKFYQEKWEGFGITKNKAVRRCVSDWIFVLDADERITEELKDELLAIEPEACAYKVARKSFFGNTWIKHCGWYPDFSLRFFKNGKALFKEVEVHEALEVEGSISELKSPMLHYTYKDVSDFVQRLNRYTSLSAREKECKSNFKNMLDIMFRPIFTFLKLYILKKGFMQGFDGFKISGLYAFSVFVKYLKIREKGKIHEKLS